MLNTRDRYVLNHAKTIGTRRTMRNNQQSIIFTPSICTNIVLRSAYYNTPISLECWCFVRSGYGSSVALFVEAHRWRLDECV